MATPPTKLKEAKQLLSILWKDREGSLLRIDDYVRGIQDDPYTPENADDEYKKLVERSKTNVMDFIVSSSAQAMYVDSFRRGNDDAPLEAVEAKPALKPAQRAALLPEWVHWQKSRLDARQSAIYRGALIFGHSFTLTELTKKQVRTTGLSPLRTAAIYEDPANDETPYMAIHVTKWPKGVEDDKDNPLEPGTARMWDAKYEYAVTFKSAVDLSKGVTSKRLRTHGADECPITRFAATVDLEGRTCGVVEPMMPLQDRINQTVFDMLIVQSFASFKVRTISGMAPPVKMRPLDEDGNEITNPERDADKIFEWVPRLNANGQPIPENVNLNARRVFWAEDHETRFSTLDETPLDGFIEAIKLAFQHMAALSQTPPHHLLGQVANLSADALQAAEDSLLRKVEEFRSSFGESWERVFRLAAQIGDWDGEDDYTGEVLWRDVQSRSLASSADALGKLAENLGIPRRGLWNRVPDVTAGELQHWESLEDQDNADRALAASVRQASATGRPTFRASQQPTAQDEAA